MIRRFLGRSLLAGAALAALTTGALAQTPPKLWFDPAQLPALQGSVERYILSPRGPIDGLLLTDGTQVVFPPHSGVDLGAVVKPGDAITVHGLKARSAPVVSAISVTNTASGQTVEDPGPAHGPGEHHGHMADGNGPAGAGSERMQRLEVHGTVKATLYGARAEPAGALLDDGTAIRVPPQLMPLLADKLAVGKTVYVRGGGVRNERGTAVEARAIGPSATDMTELPRGPGHGKQHGPGAGHGDAPPAPPPPAPPAQ